MRDSLNMFDRVQSSLKELDSGTKWRGNLDGLRDDNFLSGWALLAVDPWAVLTLDLYIHDVHIATTSTNIDRHDVDKILETKNPTRSGFLFDQVSIIAAGALELLRKFGRGIPDANLIEDIRICIAGTRHSLPVSRPNANTHLDLTSWLSKLAAAAAVQLRQEIEAYADVTQLSIADLEILLLSNPLFLADWYGDTFGEVRISGLDPVEHYVRFAADLERSPGPWFDAEDYLAASPKPQHQQLAPLLHYELLGHEHWWPGRGRFRDGVTTPPKKGDFALLIHLYNLDTVPDLQRLISQFPDDADVFISIPEDSPDYDPSEIAALFPQAEEILTVPDRGQDVSAFLETVRKLKRRGYRFFCKVHSGKGSKYPDTWRRIMLDALAATPERVAEVTELFRTDPRVLIAGPSQFWLDGSDFELGSGPRIKEFMTRLGFGDGAVDRDWAFFAGTCFWIDAQLAELIAEAVTAEDFEETKGTRNEQTVPAVERLFSLVTTVVGGRVALVDGQDWVSAIAVPDDPVEPRLTTAQGEGVAEFQKRHLQSLMAPKIVQGTAARHELSDTVPHDMFGMIDSALHGTIDVVISCWNGRPEVLHQGLVDLGYELERQGLTWSALVGAPSVENIFHAGSCRSVVTDSLYLSFPSGWQDTQELISEPVLRDETALCWLRSEKIFRNKDLPTGTELQAAISNIRRLYACWRGALIRRKVKLFLIWGNTAPKSRLFIHLCKELGIEYQIIERGHFPGTISIDPMGQFGTGARPRLIEQTTSGQAQGSECDTRFEEIRAWYDTQQDNAAYAQFQQRDTRDLDIMRRARGHGRPVILVIGGNDQGGGITGPDPDPLRVNWFESSDHAFTIIRRLVAAKFPDALLVLRPHPSQAPQEGEFLLVARESSLDDLVENADLCITMATTASAICLLKEKPLLTLGLSELNGTGVGEAIVDETHLLAALRRHIWNNFEAPYPDGANRRFIADLFDRYLVGIDRSVPTRHDLTDLARLIAGRIQRMKTGFLQEYAGREDQISQAMFEDVRDRGRATFPVDPRAFTGRERPPISVVLPIYGDYEGTRICFDQLVRHQKENGYRVITVWDRGPDLRLRDICLEYAEKAGFTYLENCENVGFSGTVNSGILHAGRDDVILLNSDTVPCGDWALRLQDAAYAHPKIASVVPFSNNATIYSIPFPEGEELPKTDPVEWTEFLDWKARQRAPRVVEMPISHGYCTYVRRSTFDRLGYYSEIKFGKGHGEDNEFSMRARAAGFFCGCATQVLVGHAGSTSFAEDAMRWKLAGRREMNNEFSHYFEEVQQFFRNDPLASFRNFIIQRSIQPQTEVVVKKGPLT